MSYKKENKNLVFCEICGQVNNNSPCYPICDACSDEGWWLDPIGTIHSPNADPLKAYE